MKVHINVIGSNTVAFGVSLIAKLIYMLHLENDLF